MGEWANRRIGEWANILMGEWANILMGEWANGQMGNGQVVSPSECTLVATAAALWTLPHDHRRSIARPGPHCGGRRYRKPSITAVLSASP